MNQKENRPSVAPLFKLGFALMLMLSMLISTYSPPVMAAESSLPRAPIVIDGKPMMTRYMLREGHLLVPAKFLKNTGAFVDWNEQYRSVVIQGKGVTFALLVGQNVSDDYHPATGQWVRRKLAAKTVDFAGEIFIPLIEVAKKMNMDVRYDPALKRTYITSHVQVQPNAIRSKSTQQKLVALTFDDGPEGHYTPQILDILKEKGVPATFFVVGRQVQYFPGVMRRIVEEGHGIANHTFTHPNLSNAWSADVRKEIVQTQEEMARTVGRRPDLFRPPYGALTKADTAVLNQIGMRSILWSVDTLDWAGLSADEILDTVLNDISPGGIILQHNFQSQTGQLDGSVEALPRIIDELRARGYRFVTVQTLLSD